MAAARGSLAYLALTLALMSAVPAMLVLSSEVISLGMIGLHEGPFATETRQAASQFMTSSQGAAVWLGVSALMFGNFLLTRIWACVAAL